MRTRHATAEERLVDILQSTGPCTLDEVLTYLPDLSWGEVFLAVDRMSRRERVLLRQVSYSTSQIALNR